MGRTELRNYKRAMKCATAYFATLWLFLHTASSAKHHIRLYERADCEGNLIAQFQNWKEVCTTLCSTADVTAASGSDIAIGEMSDIRVFIQIN